ncbi:hypothetical protein JB92DRAFT_3133997 [Gautieria morchelliformis]|nr:hypothetical protein JB92DRAFT_3133997 [Gautieria morchelliformis]
MPPVSPSKPLNPQKEWKDRRIPVVSNIPDQHPLEPHDTHQILNAFRGMSTDNQDASDHPNKVHPAFVYHTATRHSIRRETRRLMQDLATYKERYEDTICIVFEVEPEWSQHHELSAEAVADKSLHWSVPRIWKNNARVQELLRQLALEVAEQSLDHISTFGERANIIFSCPSLITSFSVATSVAAIITLLHPQPVRRQGASPLPSMPPLTSNTATTPLVFPPLRNISHSPTHVPSAHIPESPKKRSRVYTSTPLSPDNTSTVSERSTAVSSPSHLMSTLSLSSSVSSLSSDGTVPFGLTTTVTLHPPHDSSSDYPSAFS